MKTTMILCFIVVISMVTADDYSGQDNPNYYQCDSQVDISTKYHFTTNQPTTSKHVKVITPCPLYKYGFYEDPSDCGAFFQCSPAGLVRTKCAKGTLYDRNIQRCNTKEFVTCYSGVSCPRPFGLFPDPRFCNKFLNCFKNIPYVQACPAGLVFNAVAPGKGFCDYPKYVHCGGREIAVIKVHKPVIVKRPVHIPVVKKPVHKVVVDKCPIHKVCKIVVKRPVVKHHGYTPFVKHQVDNRPVIEHSVEHPVYARVVKKPIRKIVTYIPDERPVHIRPRYDNDD